MSSEAYPEFYHRTHEVLKLESQFLQQRIIEIQHLSDYINVLDLACGTGRLSHILKSADHLVSLDCNFAMLQFRQKQEFYNEALFQADNRRLPFKSNCFDMVVLAMNSIAYFSPKDVLLLMGEVNRVLKSNGAFILDQLNPEYLVTDDQFVELVGPNSGEAYEKISQKQSDGWRRVTRKYCSNDGNIHNIDEFLYFHELEKLRNTAYSVGFKTCLVWNGFGKSRVHRKSSRWVFEIRS